MRVRGFLALTTFAAVATSVVLPGATAACSFCRYTAWNCSVEEEAMKETSVQALSVDKSELRKETVTEPPLAVCNAEGKIQVDDVFCTDSDCVCAEGKRCASLVLGCQKIFQARSRKRCIGDEAIEQRFHKCARTHALTTQAKANLEADWVHFKDPKQCRSADCAAVRQFHQCGAVECGRLVVAWKESATQDRVVVDGSRASDMEAGTFLFSMDATSSGMCKSITSKKIPDCYSLQTRNQKNGNCDGIYLQADTNLLAADEEHHLSDLSWPVWLTVVGSVGAALASVASVIIVVLRHRRERQQEECSELLPDDSAELKTPELDPKEAKEASTLADRSLRQRPLSPLQE